MSESLDLTRIKQLIIAIVSALALTFAGLAALVDDCWTFAQTRTHHSSASGKIVFVGYPRGYLDASRPENRVNLTKALARLDKLGAAHVTINELISAPSQPAADAALAKAIAGLGSHITLAQWIQSAPDDGMRIVSSLPAITGNADQALAVRDVTTFGIAWMVAPSFTLRGRTYTTLPAALAGLDTDKGDERRTNYTITPASIPTIHIDDLLDPAKTPANTPSLAKLQHASVLIGADNFVDEYSTIPGHGLVVPSLGYIVQAESLLNHSPFEYGQLSLLIITSLLLVLAISRRAMRSRRRLYAMAALPLGICALVTMVSSAPAAIGASVSLLVIYGALRTYSLIRKVDTQIDPITGLPNFHALAARMDGREDTASLIVVVANVLNYNEALASLPTTLHGAYTQEIAKRMRGADSDRIIYKGHAQFFAWLEEGDTIAALSDHLEGLQALFAPPLVVAGRQIDAMVTLSFDATAEIDAPRKIASACAANLKRAEGDLGVKVAAEQAPRSREWHVSMLGAIDEAITNNQIFTVFQPKIDLATGHVIGAEALVRWQHKQMGYISPAEFIEHCERSGRIKKLTRRVLELSMTTGSLLRKIGHPINIAVNASTTTLDSAFLIDTVMELAESTGFPTELLTMEITETSRIADYDKAQTVLSQLRAIGVKISMDDFGVGTSGFSTLLALPFDELKVDRAFVSRITADPRARDIVGSIVHLCRSAQISMVAEGVENQDTLECLQHMGCQYAQGYHLSRPLTSDALIDFIMRTNHDLPQINRKPIAKHSG